MNITLFSTGFCTNIEKVVLRDGRFKKVRFNATCALIQHPRQPPLLFDTGYSPHIFTHTKRLPYSLYRLITPITSQPHERANNFVQDLELNIFISHFHADHIGGLHDFPNASFIYPKSAYDAVKDLRGLSALRHAFIPDLIPHDFAQRSAPINDNSPAFPTPFEALPKGYDIFGDGSAIAISLPGHAVGHMGLFLPETNLGAIFLIADASWHIRAIREGIRPHPIARLAIHDYTAYIDTLDRLRDIYHRHPDVIMIPTHCQEMWQKYGSL